MDSPVIRPILEGLTIATGVPVVKLNDCPAFDGVPLVLDIGKPTPVDTASGRYLLCRYHLLLTSVIVAGPYRLDGEGDLPLLPEEDEERLGRTLQEVSVGFGEHVEGELARAGLTAQLDMIGNAVLAIVSELDLEAVLRRIVELAREVADAQYAALGVPDENGEMIAFITSGMSAEAEAAIGHPPRGLGVLGLLISDPRVILLSDLAAHPASVGFPPNHPSMKSFLGVPIVARGRVLGSIYLTEKRHDGEFTSEDARLVEVLARHAAVAIENARLFQQIERQQQRLQHILDQLPEATVLVEANPEQVTLANPQASLLLGWEITTPLPVERFLERNPRRNLDGTLVPDDAIPIYQSLRDGEVIHQREVVLNRPYDPPVTLLVNSVPLYDERSRITGAIVVFQDITKIRDAEQLKDDFLSLVSHELRTPLTTIQGGAHMLMDDRGALDAETRQGLISDIYSESRRLATLVENMVQLANIRAGRFEMETEPVSVSMLINRAVAAVQESAPDREFKVEIDRTLLVEGDFSRLDQVVRNLLHNAVKYAPGRSPIEVTASAENEVATIAVRDYGPGIDPDDLPHVFERFRRGARAAASQRAGMGLGLYLCKHLVEAHGGRIWIERPSFGGGSRVCFTVPLVED